MTARDQWLTQIRSNPSDWQTMLVFADWLEDDGDLLAAEQWRWIACVDAKWRHAVLRTWPTMNLTPGLLPDEFAFARKHNIRCMPTYPTSLEDVERYYQNAARQPI